MTTITAEAPVRVADIGGWTDTWFAGSGRVCSVAVEPGVRVVLRTDGVAGGRVSLSLDGGHESYSFDSGCGPGRQPLLEAAVAAMPPTVGAAIEVSTLVPTGSGMGASASVTVALLAALSLQRDGVCAEPGSLALLAHRVETGLGWQSGVQDQWAAACGGVSDLTIDYPDTQRRAIVLDPPTSQSLDDRLLTVYVGVPHTSSRIHEEVITRLATNRPGPIFRRLREAADDAARALSHGDLARYGAAMVEHHEVSRQLHPGLVGARAEQVIEAARSCGALGWKCNGAGGDGGTVTVLGPHGDALADLRAAIGGLRGCSVVEHRLAFRGVRAAVTE